MPFPETWVAIGFVIFVGVLAYLDAYRKLIDRLDARQIRIKAELDEARRLHAEARSLLAEIEHKRLVAQSKALSIISAAEAEAERLAEEAHAQTSDLITRRTKMADSRIAHVEAQAIAEVRAAAVDAAISAAETLLRSRARSDSRNSLLSQNIRDARKGLDGARWKIALDAAE